ncbi:hypothetical protein WH95_10145 [Kiloniella litopenaei]|uniref:Phosphoesterase n=1 Tax=Kiloniella litopenaei TaxID=1549748 RepID=A0A0M2R5P6_9PROT|nr:metallophosphoesterase family protein [Kiloniella litopenaei]KKJ77016.1 hypothetical protein WH95_10145 [Kiloniella litopenaei]
MKIGLLSDAHGHCPAFERGLSLLKAAGAEQIYFLGDSIGYIADKQVVQLIRNSDIQAVRGNHEAMLNEPPEDSEGIYQIKRCRDQLSDEEVDFLTSLPEKLEIQIGDLNLLMCHGAPDNLLFGYLYPDTDLEKYNDLPYDVCISGHTHRPMHRTNSAGRVFLNPGSCGMPRDTGKFGSVAIFDADTMGVQIIRYDISDITSVWLQKCAPVHEVVAGLFKRKVSSAILGKVYE